MCHLESPVLRFLYIVDEECQLDQGALDLRNKTKQNTTHLTFIQDCRGHICSTYESVSYKPFLYIGWIYLYNHKYK